MRKKEDLLRALEEAETKLLEFREKEDQTLEDFKAVNGLCDDIEAINSELEVIERSERALGSIRRPEVEAPMQPKPQAEEQRGFSSMGQYFQAVAAASMPRGSTVGEFAGGVYDSRLMSNDPELRASPSGHAEATPSLGGFLVQQDYSNELFQKAHAASIIWAKTRQIPISGRSNGLKIPGVDETSRAAGSRSGGIRGYWLDEAGTLTASTAKLFMIELSLKKLIGLTYATEELLEDTTALESLIGGWFRDEFAFKLDEAVIRGTGAGQPLGILNAACLVSFTRTSSSTLADDDVLGVYARMFPASHANAEWYTNVDCLPNLMSMTNNANGYENIWMPGGRIQQAPYDTLMGKPVNYVETASTEGTIGDLMYLDLSQYVTISKGGMNAAQSMHVQFLTDQMAFRFTMRVDGQPMWNSALTPNKGSDTQGPFVVVAT